MKKYLILAALTVFVPIAAFAYSSAVGVDPKNDAAGFGDYESKQIVKSAVAGSSEALVPGLVVAYDGTADDGYTVTRAVTQSAVGLQRAACVTLDSVATGDTAYHRCLSKGFARVRYRAVYAIEDGVNACIDADGYVRGCDIAKAGEATADLGIIPLEAKSAGASGTDLKVMINLQ